MREEWPLSIAFAVLAAGSGVGACTSSGNTTAPTRESDAGLESTVAPEGGGSQLGADGGSDLPTFTIDALTLARIGSANGTGWTYTSRAFADVDWKEGPFARVVLRVDLDTACYPFEKWRFDPPPPGQNWPADCDAFDRNFNIFIDDAATPPADTEAEPAFEVIHAITPFGGPEHLEADITDLANARPGEHRLRVDLVSFSDPQGQVTGSNNGWTVSAHIDVTVGPPPRHVLAAIPLFTGQLLAQNVPPLIPWEVPPGATAGRLEYRASGHGGAPPGPGCVGPAEEFCDRRHQVFIDGMQVKDIEPFRRDCQTLCTLAHFGAADSGFNYCLENPGGAIASVRAPRANWCPGSMTPPYVWEDVPALTVPGSHTFSFAVSTVIADGNWQISAVYYAYGP